jgi:hypothetical protein
MMAPENPLASPRQLNSWVLTGNPSSQGVTRLQAQAHGHATRRASVQRHTRAQAKLPPIYLINNEYLNAPVRLQPSKSYHVELVASKKLTTGIHPIITKFNEQS